MPAASASPAPVVDTGGPDPHRRPARHAWAVGITLTPLRLFLIAGWGRAAIEKVIDPTWWSAQHLRSFLDEQGPDMLPWFGWLADVVLEPFAPQVAIIVLVLQIGIAMCLAMNVRLRQALWAGVALNLCFTMAGRVNPSAFYLVMQLTMLFALSRPIARTIAVRRAVIWSTLAIVVLPFARTVHPREVIDDPALMLSFLAVTAAATTLARSFSVAEMASVLTSTSVGSWAVRLLDRIRVRVDPAAATPGEFSRP